MTRAQRDKIKKFTYCYCSIINNGINTHENNSCPRGEIGRHKGLKILAACGVPVRVWPRAPSMSDPQIIFDKNKKSILIKNQLIKKINQHKFKKSNLLIVIGGDGFMLQTLKKNRKNSLKI